MSELGPVPRGKPEALVADFARRASAARAIAAVFLAMSSLAFVTTLAMTRSMAAAGPQLAALPLLAGAFWLGRSPARANSAGALLIATMLGQYVASSFGVQKSTDAIAIGYFVSLATLVAAATMRLPGVLACGAAGVGALLLMGWHRGNVVAGGWAEMVGPGYYFAATWIVAVFATLGSERVLRAHVRDELRAAQAQQAKREAEGRYRLVSDQVDDLVSVLDDQGRFAYLSPSHERVLGMKPNELVGRAAPEIVHPEDFQAMARAFLACLEHGSAFAQARLRGVDERYRVFHIRFSKIQPGSDVAGMVAVSARDVTDQHALSQALEGTRRMESLGRLAGGVAHDFNNLLLVIQACADLTARQLPEEHAAQSDLADLQRTTQRAAALTRQLLTFARRQVLATQQTSAPTAVVREFAPILERLCGKDIRVKFDVGADSTEVAASAVELEQILMNLTANAKDAMAEGGTLDVAVHPRKLAEGEAGELPAGDYVELVFRDTGVGMSDEVKARIFEPFYTTKAAGSGTGLGLATVFGLVSQLRGQVTVSSALGNGSEFRVLLPKATATAQAPAVEAKLPPDKSLDVLVIDDEEVVRTLIARLLVRAGHRVTQASDSASAQTAAKGAVRFDLILSDVVLGSDDGLAVLDSLRTAQPQAALLVMSGFSPTPERVAELARQGAEFLAKPFGADQLLAALSRASAKAATTSHIDLQRS